jgi:hypothetical protein
MEFSNYRKEILGRSYRHRNEGMTTRSFMIRTHTDALNHVINYCQARKSDYRDFIHSIAQAKGLEKRVGEEQAQEFLNGSSVFPSACSQIDTQLRELLRLR